MPAICLLIAMIENALQKRLDCQLVQHFVIILIMRNDVTTPTVQNSPNLLPKSLNTQITPLGELSHAAISSGVEGDPYSIINRPCRISGSDEVVEGGGVLERRWIEACLRDTHCWQVIVRIIFIIVIRAMTT